MPDTTYANPNMESLGRNKDSSGVYFDENGNPLAKTTFTKPTTDISGAVKDFENQFFQNPSAKLEGSTYSVLKTDLTSSSFMLSLKGIDHLGKETDIPYGIYLRDSVTFNGKKTTRGNEPTWIYTKAELNDYISSASKAWLDMANKDKEEAEKKVALQAASYVKGTNDEVDKVCSLLGLSTADAIAYLAAGGSVEAAAKKITEWNLASPSQRKSLIASQGKNFNASEYKSDIILPPIVYKAKSPEDLYKGIRNPYNERNATKSYIALVKDASKLKDQNDKTPTLLTLKEFYMQSISELDSEKYQIVETFNKPKIYFFDRRARIYQYSFIVENVGLEDINLDPKYNVKSEIDKYKKRGNLWRDLFKNTYDLYLRGTKCVENRVKAVIHYDEVTRLGYILSCSMNMDAQNENVASVQITMFVEDEQQRNVLPSVDLEYNKDKEIIKAVQDTKKTILVPYCDPGTITENIKVINYSANNHWNRIQKPFKLKLKEVDAKDNILDVTKGKSANGEVRIKDIKIIYGETSKTEKEAVFIVTDNKNKYNPAYSLGENLYVPEDGLDIYPYVDTLSKFIIDNNGEAKKIVYSIEFESTDKKTTTISGVIELNERTNYIQGRKDGSLLTTRINDIFTTVIDSTESKDEGTINNTTNFKTLTLEFNIEYIDQISNTKQDFPVDTINDLSLEIDKTSLKGTINKDDPSYVKARCTFVKDDTIFKCKIYTDVNINNRSEPEFTSESCIFKGSTKIGNAQFNLNYKYIRGFDKKNWNVIHSKVNKGTVFLIEEKAQVTLTSDIELYFDEDPTDSIQKEVYLDEKQSCSVDFTAVAIKDFKYQDPVEKANNTDLVKTSILFLSKQEISIEDYTRFTNKTSNKPVFLVKFSSVTKYPGTFSKLLSVLVDKNQKGGKITGTIRSVNPKMILKISKTKWNIPIDISYVNGDISPRNYWEFFINDDKSIRYPGF